MFRTIRNNMTVGGLIVMGLALYGGYRIWDDYKAPYRLVSENSGYYLVEKSTNRQKQITKEFQLGSPEYRLEGLMHESKDKVLGAIDELVKKYGK
jgi:hypothetical protein